MLAKASKWLVEHICLNSDIDRQAVCVYGCDLLLYTLFSTIGLLMIGFLLGSLIETILIITIFYVCQSNGGGYHANTHMRCFMTMVCGLVTGLTIIHIPMATAGLPIMAFIAAALLLVYPLHLHHNKQYLVANATSLTWRSRVITICIALGVLLLGIISLTLFYSGCIALVLSAVSRCYAIFQTQRKC